MGASLDHRRVALRRAHGLRRDQHASASTTCARTSTARTTAARRGREIVAGHSRRRRPSTSCAKIRSGAGCSSPAPSTRSTSRSTTATTGSRCGSTCRRRRSAISSIKDDDLVVGTHGRGFWILDDITPLRQVDAERRADAARCSAPARAMARALEQEHRHAAAARRAAGREPARRRDRSTTGCADGAQRAVTLEILDAAGALVRRYRSDDPARAARAEAQHPRYWIRPGARCSRPRRGCTASCGTSARRRPTAPSYEYPISAVYRNTPREPRGPWALPGRYTVRRPRDRRRHARVHAAARRCAWTRA